MTSTALTASLAARCPKIVKWAALWCSQSSLVSIQPLSFALVHTCSPAAFFTPSLPAPTLCSVLTINFCVVLAVLSETCRSHIKSKFPARTGKAFEGFEAKCLKVDGLALVEYCLDLRAQHCIIDLGDGNHAGRHRRMQFLNQILDSKSRACPWDMVNNFANDVDKICCGADGSNCVKHKPPAGKCSPASQQPFLRAHAYLPALIFCLCTSVSAPPLRSLTHHFFRPARWRFMPSQRTVAKPSTR